MRFYIIKLFLWLWKKKLQLIYFKNRLFLGLRLMTKLSIKLLTQIRFFIFFSMSAMVLHKTFKYRLFSIQSTVNLFIRTRSDRKYLLKSWE